MKTPEKKFLVEDLWQTKQTLKKEKHKKYMMNLGLFVLLFCFLLLGD
jgi:hypothetical protein